MEELFIISSSFRETLKLFHFTCKTYAQHKATDEMISSFDDLYDSLLEALQGLKGKRLNLKKVENAKILIIKNEKEMDKYVQTFVKFLGKYRKESSEISNIIDEIVAKIDRYKYLLSFK